MKNSKTLYSRLQWIVWLLLTALCATSGTAQTGDWQWRELTRTGGAKPEARRNGAAIFDPVGKRFVVVGGTSDSGLLNDVWAYDVATNVWTKLATTGTAPGGRLGFDAVYDSTAHQMVIYAGQGNSFFNDTWTLNLTTLAWRDVSPANENARPKRRYGSASVYDPVARSLVQFAGFTSESGRFQDTQSFGLANNAWSDVTPAGTKPQVRCLLTAAYDKANRRMVIYGGQRSGALDDLWSFDLAGRTWTNLTPATRPTGRYFANSAVDGANNFLLFGGQTNSGNSNELWSFNLAGGNWTKLTVAGPPSARNGAMSAYDEANDRWYIFGGTGNGNLNDLWELRRQPSVTNVTAVSSASYNNERLAAESISTLFGSGLATGTQVAATVPLPTTLLGTSVRVKDSLGNERLAPLFFVSPAQINFLIPTGTANGSATMTVYAGETLIAAGAQNIQNTSPGLFTANGNGSGAPAAILFRVYEDFSHTTEDLLRFDAGTNRWVSKAIYLGKEKEEVYLILYGTGFRFSGGLANVTATIGGIVAPVSFAGAQGGFVGLDQVNVRIPRALIGRGEVDVVLNVSGVGVNTVRIAVK